NVESGWYTSKMWKSSTKQLHNVTVAASLLTRGWDGVHHEFDNSSSSYSDTDCDVNDCSYFDLSLAAERD
ncbi:hypothetical protein FCV25MIE_03274, partial [Fagus crenata]